MRTGLAVLFLLFAQTALAERSSYTDEGCAPVNVAPVMPMPSPGAFQFPTPMSMPPLRMAKVCWTKHVKMNSRDTAKVKRWRMTWTVKFRVFDVNGNMIWESPEKDGSDMGVMVRGKTVMNKTQDFTVEYDGECVSSTYTTTFDTMKKSVVGSFSDFTSCS